MSEEYVKKTMCLSEIKGMGFTDKLIKELLPEPELKVNPHYKKAAPMKLWQITDVEAAMEDPSFKKAMETRAKRKAASKKAVKTKTENLLALVQNQITKISVSKIDIDTLRKETLSEKQDWYNYLALERDCYVESCARAADEDTVKRWMVNYIRHNLTHYDRKLMELTRTTAGKTGKHKAYLLFFEAVMGGIADVYPEFKDECDRQIARKVVETQWAMSA